MMAAFIIAVQGTVAQAVLLGLAATLSHTAVVWVIALAGQHLGREWGGEAAEPYFQLASAVVIVGIALWMAWRTWRERHDAHHYDEHRRLATRDGPLTLEIFEDEVPPRWRLRAEGGPLPAADTITVETVRRGGIWQALGSRSAATAWRARTKSWNRTPSRRGSALRVRPEPRPTSLGSRNMVTHTTTLTSATRTTPMPGHMPRTSGDGSGAAP
jgi:ABC-type nickel/cobalt efflux system permease component RcnA